MSIFNLSLQFFRGGVWTDGEHASFAYRRTSILREESGNSDFGSAPASGHELFPNKSDDEPCIVASHRPVEPMSRERALKLCEPVRENKVAFEHCVFDAIVMGAPGVGAACARSLALRDKKAAIMPLDIKTLNLKTAIVPKRKRPPFGGRKSLEALVAGGGFEPPTFGL